MHFLCVRQYWTILFQARVCFAIEKIDAVNDFLQQGTDEKFLFDDILKQMKDIFADDRVSEEG